MNALNLEKKLTVLTILRFKLKAAGEIRETKTTIRTEFTRGPGRRDTSHSDPFSMKLCQVEGTTQ